MNHTKELQWSLWVNIYTHITHLYIYIYKPPPAQPTYQSTARTYEAIEHTFCTLGAQDCSTRVLFHSIVELFVGFSFVVLNLNFKHQSIGSDGHSRMCLEPVLKLKRPPTHLRNPNLP